MGKNIRVEKKKIKKKKGRPSLLDLQKRQLKRNNDNNNNNNLLINSPNNNNTKIKKINISTPNLPPPPGRQRRRNSTAARSTRRKPNPNSDDSETEEEEDDDDYGLEGGEVDSGEEREFFGCRKRKIDSISSRSEGVAVSIDDVVEKQTIAVTNLTNNQQVSNEQDDGPSSTPLPDKKLLFFILDSLQKKDTYGVFAEPVDPEELPDYHEIIKHPMDYSTVRKKLEDGAYNNLEQFEKDIFLICSNAMQYNSPDSIYFRQARSMQELARKNFDNLRQDSDDNDEVEPEPKDVRRGRPPKNLKRPPGRPPIERANSDFSDVNLANAGGSASRLNEHKKAPSHLEKYGSTGSFARTSNGSRKSEANADYAAKRSERSDELIGSTSSGYSLKHGKIQIVVDESRRDTYQNSSELACEPSVLTTFQTERKHLIAIGLHAEYGYARSLARFAAKLGPAAWNVASKNVERCLPAGIKFGQGWVGENEAPSERLLQQLPDVSGRLPLPATTPHGLILSNDDMSEQKSRREPLSEMDMPAHHPKKNNKLHNATPTLDAGRISASISSPSMPGNGTHSDSNLISPGTNTRSGPRSMVNMVSTSTGPVRSGNKVQVHQTSTFQSTGPMRSRNKVQAHQTSTIQSRHNGINGSYGLNFAPQMVKNFEVARHPSVFTEPSPDDNRCGEAKLSFNSAPIKASDSSPNTGPHQKVGSALPDLNVGFQSSGSSGSVQPELALQL